MESVLLRDEEKLKDLVRSVPSPWKEGYNSQTETQNEMYARVCRVAGSQEFTEFCGIRVGMLNGER